MSAANIPYFTFNNGIKVPSVGMGCWMGQPGGGEEAEEMCANALKMGYRHIDTAFGYGNEEHVGKAIRNSGIPREEIFVTTKLGQAHHHKVEEGFETSLKNLGLDYVDLYLMHWPQAQVDGVILPPEQHPTIIDTWKDMEKLVATGKVKSIGVSNFSIQTLSQLLPHCTIKPVTNQVELHPCLPSHELKKFCEDNGILLTAYSPLGQSNHLFFDHPDIVLVATAHNATPAQVSMSWSVQRGTIVIAKSAKVARMKENITLFQLTPEEMTLVDNVHKTPGFHRSLLAYHDDDGSTFGWKYEYLGWPFTKGGIVASSA
ncbi:hypothetical protein NLI96_g2062 [Meripilus lineatus]|uniref:NADP-dependent oxidoreductase domain-containing protein n=1 Tax=Meripilus lineatus TaxID=2056292 RepID=A0AAD5V997_9APHY|nr:hypothetical protein NLI96_g2062 [Physisporinus lineatus]